MTRRCPRALAWRRRAGELVPAVSAGLFAAWVALAFRVALNGTPFGPTGLQGDQVRMAAAAAMFTATEKSSTGLAECLAVPSGNDEANATVALTFAVPAASSFTSPEPGATPFTLKSSACA